MVFAVLSYNYPLITLVMDQQSEGTVALSPELKEKTFYHSSLWQYRPARRNSIWQVQVLLNLVQISFDFYSSYNLWWFYWSIPFFLGHGTSHKVNGIINKPGDFNEIVNDSVPPKRKCCRRSFNEISEQRRTDYLSGNRIGPTNLTFCGMTTVNFY